MAISWTVTADFGAGAVDISGDVAGIQRTVRTHRVLRPTVNTARFVVHDRDRAKQFLADTDTAIVIQKDASDWFTGLARPRAQARASSHWEELQVEVVDRSILLQQRIDTTFSWQDYAVCDTGTTSQSIVHQLLVTAGVSLGDMSLTDVTTTITRYTIERSQNATYWDEIAALLYEYGYVLDVDESGDYVMREMHPTSISTSAIDDDDFGHGLSLLEPQRAKYEAARVKWHPVVTLKDTLVFSDRSGGDAENPCNVAVESGDFYPDGADGSTPVYAVYDVQDAEVLDIDNAVLVWTSTGNLSVHTEAYGAKRADIRFSGGGDQGGVLTQFDIRADAVIRDRTKRRKSVVYGVAGSERILEHQAKFIESSSVADQLASDLVNYYDLARYQWSGPVMPGTALTLHGYYALTSTVHDRSADVRVVELTEDEMGFVRAVLEEIDEYSALSTEAQNDLIGTTGPRNDDRRKKGVSSVATFLGTTEQFTVQAVADSGGSLGGTYFTLSTPSVDYYVWIDVDNGSTDPAPAGRGGIEVDIATGDSAATVASAVQAAIDALGDFAASVDSDLVTVTLQQTGNVTDAADVDTGFTITKVRDGSDSDSPVEDNARWEAEDDLIRLQRYDGTQWVTEAQGGGTDGLSRLWQGWLARVFGHLSAPDTGDRVPHPTCLIFDLDNDYEDQWGVDRWPTQNGTLSTSLVKFGSHALLKADLGSEAEDVSDAFAEDGDDLVVSFWFRQGSSLPTSLSWATIRRDTANNEIRFETNGSQEAIVSVIKGGSSASSAGIAISADVWYLVTIWWDESADQARLLIDETSVTVTNANAWGATTAFSLRLAGRTGNTYYDDILLLSGTDLSQSTDPFTAHRSRNIPWTQTTATDDDLLIAPQVGQRVLLGRTQSVDSVVASIMQEYVAQRVAAASTPIFNQNPATTTTWYDVDFSGENGYRPGARWCWAVARCASGAGTPALQKLRVRRKGDSIDGEANILFAVDDIDRAVLLGGFFPTDINGVAQIQNSSGGNRSVQVYEPTWSGF